MLIMIIQRQAAFCLLMYILAAACGCIEIAEAKLPHASYKGDIQQAKALLGSGVDVNSGDRAGFTALHQVTTCKSSEVALELTQILLAAGADVNIKAQMGFTQ